MYAVLKSHVIEDVKFNILCEKIQCLVGVYDEVSHVFCPQKCKGGM